MLGLRWKIGDFFCVMLETGLSDWLDWFDGSRKLRKEGREGKEEAWVVAVVVVEGVEMGGGVGETLGILGIWLVFSLAFGSTSFFTHERIFSLSNLQSHVTVM